MHTKLRLAAGILTVLVSTNAFAATELARVNGTVITLEDFNKKYKENLKYFQTTVPTKKGVLDNMIKRELGLQEARKLGLDKDPEVADRMNTVLYYALIDKRLTKEFEAIHITDDDARGWYSRNPEVRTSHIFVAVRPDAKADEEKKAREKIQKIYDQYVKDGKMGFAEIAQRYSEGMAAPMGGDIDYQSKDKLDPTYYKTAVELRTPGKISGIIKTQFGFHIVKLTALRSWDDADKPAVKRVLFEERKVQVFDKYMGQLRTQSRVSANETLLKD